MYIVHTHQRHETEAERTNQGMQELIAKKATYKKRLREEQDRAREREKEMERGTEAFVLRLREEEAKTEWLRSEALECQRLHRRRR